ncbi:restriction endonuclease subunit S [Metamycoplasma hyosynoviae]|uniref:restriction endonuclease subunit S n=1 Tax=Metamycoplasma hyosynoviae TaxID=29559 RepID=UPI002366DD96|nr:restriction endonuclease subunit S [Metamycoplasma hyosynoviae]MDD7894833.1 restriction endonuclease subunit S [Metamycoplasma hyosynoviae]
MRTYKIKDLGKVITGKTPSTKVNIFWNSNDFPFICPPDIKNNRYISKSIKYISNYALNKFNSIKLKENSIVISCIGYIGYVSITKKLSISNQQINAITNINRNIVSELYLYYLLLTKKDYFNSIGRNGTTMPIINKTLFENIELSIHSIEQQHHIVNIIGSVDNLIENYQERINKICNILFISLKKYTEKISIKYYEPKIIKSGITKFDKTKIYIDTSKIEGINNMSNGNIITFNKRPSRANMQPIKNSVWFAKMKESNKKLIITENDFDLINDYILSTGYLGVEASSKIPLSLLLGIIISSDFNEQRDLNSVGTTMAGINNETFLNILVPKLSDDEILKYDKNYHSFINELSLLRKKINELRVIKSKLLEKYF